MQEIIVSRIVFSHNKDLLIHYLPKFTISRCPDDFPIPPWEYGHYPYFIDFKVDVIEGKKGVLDYSYNLNTKPKIKDFQQFPIPDPLVQANENARILDEILFLINSLTSEEFFQYQSNQSWMIRMDESSRDSYWGQEGYIPPAYDRELKNLTAFPDYTNPMAFTLVNDETGELKKVMLEDLLDLYFQSQDKHIKEQFMNACIVLSKSYALRKVDMSASYLFLVTAIEALIEIEYADIKVEHCTSCGQPKYQVRKKFLGFLDKYGYKVDRKTKDLFYNLRSGIAHSGQLLGMSYRSKWAIENQSDFDLKHKTNMEREYYNSFHRLVTTCFQRFIFINFKATHNQNK